jgi:bifunctional UDP-N-acetylglucosamine pyrophosphorylase/glucosamine-1-phosphate N-acetyltransferase
MMHQKMQAIVLAAGKSTRLNNGRNKLTEHICGQPMIIFTTKMLKDLQIRTTIVVGQHKEQIRHCLEAYSQEVSYISQDAANGTGHALLCTKNTWEQDHILVLNGDMPLITTDIIEKLYEKHLATNASISFVIAHNTDPDTGYGRVIIDNENIKIVEAKEYTGETSEHCCINAGIYLIKKDFLLHAIDLVQPNQTTGEYHITDLVAIACQEHLIVTTMVAPFDRVRGINNQHELWAAEQIQRANIIKDWMEQGVRFSVAHNVHIDLNVQIGSGSYIGCGTHILYGSRIGKNCHIHENVSLEETFVGDDTTIYPFTVAKNTVIGQRSYIGPFAHLQESTVSDDTTIGNFVEIKRSTVGSGSKAKHLAYIGDAEIGKSVNIGAGTITCNYDGVQKHKTVIKDNVFIGSNNTLIAPLTIEENSFTAGGSTITQDIPQNTLAVARSLQINKVGYAHHFLKKNTKKSILKPKVHNDNHTETKAQFIGAKRTTNDPIETDHS